MEVETKTCAPGRFHSGASTDQNQADEARPLVLLYFTLRTVTVGSPSEPARVRDHKLGQQLAGLIAQQAVSSLPYGTIFSHLQDLAGEDTALLGPLRDLLGRPTFPQLFVQKQHSVQLGGRDALLEDLGLTYNSAMVGRLADVIDGCLGRPLSLASSAAQPSTYASPQPFTSYTPSTPHPATQPYAATGPINYAPAGTGQPQIIQTGPSNPQTSILIALVAMLGGAVIVGLAWLFLGNRLQQSTASVPSPKAPLSTPQPAEPAADPPTQAPSKLPTAPNDSGQGAWGSASDYKFGQLPSGDYPQSCAFSRTDPSGRVNTDKSQVEFWACRDVGGDAENGYKVAWSDGKETTYTFSPEGQGAVVGTNGSSHPITWRNDTHKGDSIIVINHQDGAVSWIPGNVR